MSVVFTPRAQSQLRALQRHYDDLGRDNAASRLVQVVASAIDRIARQSGPFLPAPRPYPDLARRGWLWFKQDNYWFAFQVTSEGYGVTAVFHDAANIPGRV